MNRCFGMGEKLLKQSRDSGFSYSPSAVRLLGWLDDDLFDLKGFESWHMSRVLGDGDIFRFLNSDVFQKNNDDGDGVERGDG